MTEKEKIMAKDGSDRTEALDNGPGGFVSDHVESSTNPTEDPPAKDVVDPMVVVVGASAEVSNGADHASFHRSNSAPSALEESEPNELAQTMDAEHGLGRLARDRSISMSRAVKDESPQEQQPQVADIGLSPSQNQEQFDEYINSPRGQNVIAERSPGGRYLRFMEKLGSGATKDVYRAYDTIEGIEVAWNVVNLAGVPKAERNRIVNEVRLLERLHHHNIISFHGSWVNREKQEVNFVTEILSAGSLMSFINKVQVIRWKIAKRWAVQILNGLEYLHAQDPPVIHRDLKCDNIFINGTSGDLRIGDLGLSTVHRHGKVLSVLGTPEFMAPDLYEESAYDAKVDIYAFGMCLLQIFTKEIPYKECNNPAQIYKKVMGGIPPESLGRLRSKEAREFILLCLGTKDQATGKYVRPSASELLEHPFLAKGVDDESEVKVDPPLLHRTIVEEPTSRVLSGEQASDLGSTGSVEPSPDNGEMVVKKSRYTDSQSSFEESDHFDEMPDSEVNIRKVKVMMGRGQELQEEDHAPLAESVRSIDSATATAPVSVPSVEPTAVPAQDSVEGVDSIKPAAAHVALSRPPLDQARDLVEVRSNDTGSNQNLQDDQARFCVAAAVIQDESPLVRPYDDDILKLIIRLPVDGQTQNVQFDFHLVEDDPVQVAKEMVDELDIPRDAVLDISGTVSALARNARMKQEKHVQRQKWQQEQMSVQQQQQSVALMNHQQPQHPQFTQPTNQSMQHSTDGMSQQHRQPPQATPQHQQTPGSQPVQGLSGNEVFQQQLHHRPSAHMHQMPQHIGHALQPQGEVHQLHGEVHQPQPQQTSYSVSQPPPSAAPQPVGSLVHGQQTQQQASHPQISPVAAGNHAAQQPPGVTAVQPHQAQMITQAPSGTQQPQYQVVDATNQGQPVPQSQGQVPPHASNGGTPQPVQAGEHYAPPVEGRQRAALQKTQIPPAPPSAASECAAHSQNRPRTNSNDGPSQQVYSSGQVPPLHPDTASAVADIGAVGPGGSPSASRNQQTLVAAASTSSLQGSLSSLADSRRTTTSSVSSSSMREDESGGDTDDLSDNDESDEGGSEVEEELRRLDQDYQKNLLRARKVFDSRMDNLHRSKEEKEAQHLKTLEKHEKEQAEFEKRVKQAEKEQSRRIEHLQREWDRKREELAKQKKASGGQLPNSTPASPVQEKRLASSGSPPPVHPLAGENPIEIESAVQDEENHSGATPR